MSNRPSRAAIIANIIRKDLRDFTRDRFFMFITLVGLIAYAALYWALPNAVDETITIGIHQTGMDKIFDQLVEEEEASVKFKHFDTTEKLQQALGMTKRQPNERLQIGIDFPDDFLEHAAAGRKTTVTVYVDPAVPKEIRRAMSSLVREMAFGIAGTELPVTEPKAKTVVLGEDRAGDQVTLREKMRPLYAFLVLIMETFALGTLVAKEIRWRTATAIIVTPAGVADFLAAKGILGTLLAFTEATALMLLINSLRPSPAILLTTLFLGAVMVTGLGMIAGSTGKDFMTMIFVSLLFLVPLIMPAVAALFPGTAATWVTVLPSYGFVQAIVGVANYGEGWREVLPDLGLLLGWCAVIFTAGLAILKRKVESI